MKSLGTLLVVSLAACQAPPPDPDAQPPRTATGGGAGTEVERTGGTSGGGGNAPGTGGNSNTGGSTAPSGGGGGSATGGARGEGGNGGTTTSPDAAVDQPAAETPPANPLPPGVKGHPDPAVAYPKYPGFTLALVEEFNQSIDLDNDPIWTWSDGGLPEGAVRFFKDNITFEGGKMVLTAKRENAPGSNSYAEPVADNAQGFVPAKPLRSGEMRTKYNNYRYGRYEVRLRPPTSNGNFISTMFVFRTPKFLSWREIDIELTADRPGGVVTNMITANNVGGWNPDIQEFADMFPNGGGAARALPGGFSHQNQFHTYAFEWLPDHITWFVDDVPIREKRGGRLPIPEKSAKIIMNLWVFAVAGGFGGDPTRNTYPMAAEYDWFRFYKWDQEAKYPCDDLPGCLPAEDRVKSKNNPADGVAP